MLSLYLVSNYKISLLSSYASLKYRISRNSFVCAAFSNVRHSLQVLWNIHDFSTCRYSMPGGSSIENLGMFDASQYLSPRTICPLMFKRRLHKAVMIFSTVFGGLMRCSVTASLDGTQYTEVF